MCVIDDRHPCWQQQPQQLQTAPHVMDQPGPKTTLIDGSKHPESIPDVTDYRLFFVTVAEGSNPTDEQKQRQRAYLLPAGIGEEDLQIVADALTTFKAGYDDLIREYNDIAEVAAKYDAQPDVADVLRRQDALVQSARDSLKAALSPEALQRFDAHVQREKAKMRVTKETQ